MTLIYKVQKKINIACFEETLHYSDTCLVTIFVARLEVQHRDVLNRLDFSKILFNNLSPRL